MTSNKDAPQNAFFISKESPIKRMTDNIDNALDRFAEIQLRCAGTAVQKTILIAQACVQEGIAEYSRFTTQTILFEGKEIVYTIVKLRRPVRSNKVEKKQNKDQKKVQKKTAYQPKAVQQNRKPSYTEKNPVKQDDREKERVYNEYHRQRNERREQENYGQNNDRNRGQRNQGKNQSVTERNRDRQYR